LIIFHACISSQVVSSLSGSGGRRRLLLLVGGAVGADDAGLVAVELGDVDGGPVVDVPLAAVVVAGPHPPHPPLVAVASGSVVARRPRRRRRREAAAHLAPRWPARSGSCHARTPLCPPVELGAGADDDELLLLLLGLVGAGVSGRSI